jgi:hypothetical protein
LTVLVELFLTTGLAFIEAVLGSLPLPDMDSVVTSGGIVPAFATLNVALPLVELVALGGAALSFKVYTGAWHGLVWVYDHVPFI